MKSALTILLGLSIALVARAQPITITGKVIDRQTKDPLPFACISLAKKPISLITNDQGEFDFHIPADLRNDIVTVSMLGYKTFEAPVWSVVSPTPVVVEMQAAAVLLKEVVITDSLKAE